jgi:hypothetical protein
MIAIRRKNKWLKEIISIGEGKKIFKQHNKYG